MPAYLNLTSTYVPKLKIGSYGFSISNKLATNFLTNSMYLGNNNPVISASDIEEFKQVFNEKLLHGLMLHHEAIVTEMFLVVSYTEEWVVKHYSSGMFYEEDVAFKGYHTILYLYGGHMTRLWYTEDDKRYCKAANPYIVEITG